jgi:hypothetical protein
MQESAGVVIKQLVDKTGLFIGAHAPDHPVQKTLNQRGFGQAHGDEVLGQMDERQRQRGIHETGAFLLHPGNVHHDERLAGILVPLDAGALFLVQGRPDIFTDHTRLPLHARQFLGRGSGQVDPAALLEMIQRALALRYGFDDLKHSQAPFPPTRERRLAVTCPGGSPQTVLSARWRSSDVFPDFAGPRPQ